MHQSYAITIISFLISLFTTSFSPINIDHSAAVAGKSYLKVTFNGQTKVYTDVHLGQEGKMGKISIWEITAGSSDDYLTLSMWSTGVGTFPYKQTINQYSQVSQVEYRTKQATFNNYKALICPTKSGYYSSPGAIKVTEYVPGKLAKGTFSGALLDSDAADECSTKGVPFSGEFSINQ